MPFSDPVPPVFPPPDRDSSDGTFADHEKSGMQTRFPSQAHANRPSSGIPSGPFLISTPLTDSGANGATPLADSPLRPAIPLPGSLAGPADFRTASPSSPKIPSGARALRDAELRRYVSMRFTTQQLFDLSRTWEYPFRHLPNLRRRLKEVRLRPCRESTQLPHDREIILAFLRIAADAHRAGYKI